MRDIKFRAWDEECEQMFYSDKEYDDHFFEFKDGNLQCFRIDEAPATIDEPAYPICVPLDNLMQFTGLVDAKGKEIWEGDKVKLTGDDFFSNESFSTDRTEDESWEFFGVVKMNLACWLVENEDGLCITFLEVESEDLEVEVIGNIYER